jgi:Bacterial type III secretion protein (HrpB1_HrpK)
MAVRYGVDHRITRLLLHVGLLCGEVDKPKEAVQIIRAVRDFRDDIPHPGTVLAFVYLRMGRMQDAEEELDRVLSKYPDHQLSKALLGMVYHHVDRAGWQDLLQEVIDDGRDEWSIRLARNLLGAGMPAEQSPSGSDQFERTAHMQRLYA